MCEKVCERVHYRMPDDKQKGATVQTSYLNFVLLWMASMILSNAGVMTNDKLNRRGRIMLFAAKKPGLYEVKTVLLSVDSTY